MQIRRLAAIRLCCCCLLQVAAIVVGYSSSLIHHHPEYEAPEPYQEMYGYCSDCNPVIPQSPDPLVAMTWNSDFDDDAQLQYYRLMFRPSEMEYVVEPRDANVQIIENIRQSHGHGVSLLANRNCSIRIDWGVERAAWLELKSGNNLSSGSSSTDIHVTAAVSEFRMPYPGKTKSLVQYGNSTYRLETNKELYEGVRFTWLYIEMFNDDNTAIQIDDISLVARVKPVKYTGSFQSSNDELTRAWYTGAYGVRLNMEETNFNSILIERGDRVAIQGDGHPTIDAALVAFSPYKLVEQVLNQTDSGDHHVVDEGIMAYPLYWSLSALSYFMESGDMNYFPRLAGSIMKIVDARIQDFLEPDLDIQWFGWDDRLGNGWCFHAKGDRCPKEAHLALAGLVIRVCRDLANALTLANMTLAAQKYTEAYHELGQRLVSTPELPYEFGVHAAANAINAGIATQNETDLWMDTVLNNSVTVCSISQFNQYWILQAFGNANRMEHAIESLRLCWGTPLQLGKGCFWENSTPDWSSFLEEGDAAPGLPSYCHPWASGVTAWLSHVLAGIRPLLPGYKSFLAAPYVSTKYPKVTASIQTPAGEILVNATLVNGEKEDRNIQELHALVESPVPGYFGLRKHLLSSNGKPVSQLDSVRLNQQKDVGLLSCADLNDILGSNASLSDLSEEFVYVVLSVAGEMVVTATYRRHHSISFTDNNLNPFPEPSYPASVIGMDRESRGDGLFLHGKDGYLLVGANNGNDEVQLPDYIENVTFWKHGYPGWFEEEREFVGISPDDKTYLPSSNETVRKLGMVGYDDSRGGQINNVFLHVKTKGSVYSSFSLSVYFVAKSASHRHSIRIMDLDSLEVIAPDSFIHNYTDGVWWTLRYHRSIRLRMSNVKGIRVSAVAFASD